MNKKIALFLACVTLTIAASSTFAHTNVSVQEAMDLIASTENLTIIDVREQSAYCSGHIPGALLYPWLSGVLQSRYEELPIDGPILVVCQSGSRSNAAANFLDSQGFSNIYDGGGMSSWWGETEQCKYSGGGTGKLNDPYQITNANDWITLMNDTSDWDKNFILTADINMQGLSLSPVGDSYINFTGVLDGKGHKISNVKINAPNINKVGLFGYLGKNGQIHNTGIINITVTGKNYVGGLVGQNNGDVTRCYTTGIISGNGYVGGLAGTNCGGITQSYSTASIISGGDFIGGMVGSNSNILTHCYSTGTVGGKTYVAGLAGSNDNGTITSCYSTGIVDGNSYIGGMVGFSTGSVLYNIWDTNTSCQAGSAGGVGLTTAQMKDPYMLGMNGFANDPNWILNAGLDYPRLAWQATTGTIIPDPNINWLEGSGSAKDPYKIATAEQLLLLSKASVICNKHFILDANINLDPNHTGKFIFTQAVIPSFSGVFDGNEYTISNLIITGGSCLGMFGRLEPNALVCNLNVADVNIIGIANNIGGLVGINCKADINNCSTTGIVRGGNYIGGLVGSNNGDVNNCFSDCAVNGDCFAGGLAGSNNSKIWYCYSTGSVAGNLNVGGLAGQNYFGDVNNCYSTGLVIGDSNYAGGLFGSNYNGKVKKCYSTGLVTGDCNNVGGLIGWNIGDVNDCFWDILTSGQASSAGGTGKTTAQMQTQNTFTGGGWDFAGETVNGPNDIWWILEGKDYPKLWWQLLVD